MSTRDISRPGRRRLRTAAALAVPPLTALLFFATPPAPLAASALSPAAPSKTPTCTPIIGCPPTPSPSPSPCFSNDFFTNCSPSPSPEIIVISPVPADSPSPVVTPGYLIGIPSPSVDPGVTGGTPIPLGGGFNDLPSPGPVSAVSDTGNSGGGGFPGPLMLIGILLLVGAVGSILLAIAPRGERFPEQPAREAPEFVFTPYGPDSPELMVMDPGPDQPSRARARRPKPSA